MKQIILAGLIALIGSTTQASEYRDTTVPIQVVTEFDVSRYMGRWYEIARFPISFEKDCTNVTADYTLRDDGKVTVLNTCVKSTTGKVKTAKGLAMAVAPAVLKVSFIPVIKFFSLIDPNYYVLHISDKYDLAVIGLPKGNAGWILSRNPEIPQAQLDDALQVLQKNGYDTSQIELVSQTKE